MLLPIIVALPILAALLLLTKSLEKHLGAVVLSLAGVTAVLVTLAGKGLGLGTALWQVLPGFSLSLALDRPGWLFALLAAWLWLPAYAYALSYTRKFPENRPRFFFFYTLSLAATMGIALAGNLLTFYLFYELLTLVTWPLVFHTGTPEAKGAGNIYLGYSFVGAALILAGMGLVYSLIGTLDFIPGGQLLATDTPVGVTVTLAVILLVAGFGVKAAILPLHGWLPRAMAAPAPVSALLHAVAVVNAGCFGLFRALWSTLGHVPLAQAGFSHLLPILSVGTIVLGSVFALRQDELKKRLAYSTVSQLGYITLGIFALEEGLLTGSLVHFVNHGLMKITLFFCAGAVISQAKLTRISQLGGIGRKMPLTMAAFALASLGMIGIIPLNGFQSKWQLVLGSLKVGRPELVGVFILSGLLNALYFLPIIGKAFFEGREGWQREDLSGLNLPPLLTAAACLLLGLWPAPLVNFVKEAVALLGGM